MRLLQRPFPFKDESLRGYIVRLSEENHCENSKGLFRQLGLQKYNKFENLLVPQKKIDLSILSYLTRRSQKELNSLLLFDEVDVLNPSDGGVSFEIWRNGTCAHKQRLCSLCLNEFGYHKNCWELSLMTVCPNHNCILIDHCEGCGQRIDPYRNKICFCNCGFDFRESKVIQGQSRTSQFIAALYCNINGNEVIKNRLNTFNKFKCVYILLTLVRLVNGINSAGRSNLAPGPAENFSIIENLDRAFSAFDEWPNSFFSFLDELRMMKSNPLSFSRWNSFFAKHYSTEGFSFLVEGFKFYLTHFWKEGYKQAFSIDETEFKKVSSKISAVTKRNQETIQVVGLTSREISLRLGLGLDQVPALRENGALQAISGPDIDGQPTYKYSKESCERILLAFENAVLKESTPKQKLTFYKAVILFAFYDLALVDVIDAVLKGFIAPVEKIREEGLKQFIFDKDQIINFLKEGYLTIEDISKELAIKRPSIERWVKQGYIGYSKAFKSGTFKLISVEDYRDFRNRYIPAVEIVRNHPKIHSTEKLLRVLLQYDISPCNQKVIGGDVYLLEKSQRLEEVLSIV